MIRGWVDRATRSLRRMPSLEIHIPISPTPTMLNMVQCLTLSLRRFGGAYRDSPIILSVGDDEIDRDFEERYPWLSRMGVDVRWVPETVFREYSFYATAALRFEHEYRSDIVLFLDADILVAANFDALIRDVHHHQHFAGMIGLASPLLALEPSVTWAEIHKYCGIAQPPDLRHEYTGWPYFITGDPAHRLAPAYFNYGVVCAPAWMMKQIGPSYFAHFLKLRKQINSILITQIALTMAIVDLALPYRALPIHYNFPNDSMVEALHGAELPLAKFLHLHGKLQLNKSELYSDIEQIRGTILRTDLRGVSRKVQQILTSIEPDLVDIFHPAALA